jgi:PAS domain S-box-containing protein
MIANNKQASLSAAVNSTCSYAETDTNGVIREVNDLFCEVTGYAREEVIGRKPSFLRSNMTPKDLYKNLWDSITMGVPWRGEFINRHKNGTLFHSASVIFPIIDTTGQQSGYGSIWRDVKAMYENSTYALLNHFNVERLQMHIIINNASVMHASSEFLKFFGFDDWNHLKHVFRCFEGFVIEEDNCMSLVDMKTVMIKGSPIIGYKKVALRSSATDETHYFKIKSFEFFDNTVYHFTDITEDVLQEKFMVHQSRFATMGEVLSTVAHQWRQPLSCIQAIVVDTQFAYDAQELTLKEYMKNIASIETHVEYLSQTIKTFSDFLKPNAEDKDFNVLEAINNAVKISSYRLSKHNIAMDISPIDDPVVAQGSINEFEQVLCNLINNAIDAFTELKIIDPALLISIKTDKHALKIMVEDNAGGIPKEIINRIFEPYFSTKAAEHGTGLGLYLCQRILREHFAGELSVTNNASGASFMITLPHGGG